MIISFDGNTYLGKTSVINILKTLYPDSKVCEEYDTNPDILLGRSHLENQKYYFGLESERQIENREGQLVLLDRSYLSILAHSYAVSHMEKKNRLAETVELLKIQCKKGLVTRQQAAVFFIQPDRSALYSDVDKKGGENILYNAQYRTYIDGFYEEILQILYEKSSLKLSCLRRIYLWKNGKTGAWDGLRQWLEECVSSEMWKSDGEENVLFSLLLSAVEEILCKVSKVYD